MVFEIHAVTVNEVVTGRDIDMKMETLPRIRNVQ
jgi:hypothetical protein